MESRATPAIRLLSAMMPTCEAVGMAGFGSTLNSFPSDSLRALPMEGMSGEAIVVPAGSFVLSSAHDAVSYTHLTLPTNREV